ncbi:uncharacterized protein LOC132663584 [Panthera onca]
MGMVMVVMVMVEAMVAVMVMVTLAGSSPVSPSLPVLSASSVPAWPLPGETQPPGFAPTPHGLGHKAAAPRAPRPPRPPRAALRRPHRLAGRAPAPAPRPRARTARLARHPRRERPRPPARSPPSPRRPGHRSLTPAPGPAAPRPRDKGCAAAAPPAAPPAAATGDPEEGGGGAEEARRRGRRGGAAAAPATRLQRPRPQSCEPGPQLSRAPSSPGRGPENLPQGTRGPPLEGGWGKKKKEGCVCMCVCVCVCARARARVFLLSTPDFLHPPPRPRAISGKCQTLPPLYNSGGAPTDLLSVHAPARRTSNHFVERKTETWKLFSTFWKSRLSRTTGLLPPRPDGRPR